MCHGRFFLIPLLAFGAIAGFASGFASLHRQGCQASLPNRNASTQLAQRPAAPAPVVIEPAATQPAQTLVIPIIVGGPGQAAQVQPATIVIPSASRSAAPALAKKAASPKATP